MTDRNEAKWAKMKSLGREKYVLIYGVLLWGIVLTAITSAIQYILTLNASDADALTLRYVLARFVVFGVIGFFIATGRWMSRQRKYDHTSADEQAAASRRQPRR